MRRAIILFLACITLISVSACGFTPQGDAIRQAVATRGAEAFDEGLANAEWFICNAASVGSIDRRYGRDPELAQAWRVLCRDSLSGTIVGEGEYDGL